MKTKDSNELRDNSSENPPLNRVTRRSLPKSNVALLWDESFLWGLMALKALRANGLPFELINSEDIREGRLHSYSMLFVPGGWASNKLKTLGGDGVNGIREFVRNGGSYLGFCGGAGLATLDGMGLLNIKRKPTKERVPSFSGRIYLNIDEHPIWNGLLESSHESRVTSHELKDKKEPENLSLATHRTPLIFHAWWPSQFLVEDSGTKMLAAYGNALPDSFSSDLNTGDVRSTGNWSEFEAVYHINLNPERLLNEPAVIEGTFGNGKVVLSLVHFDTPGDANGTTVLRNLWNYLSGQKPEVRSQKSDEKSPGSGICSLNSEISDLEAAVSELTSLGTRNFLWFWRNPMLLQWRRGIRGLEYCTLYIMIKEIAEILCQTSALPDFRASEPSIRDNLSRIRELLRPFIDKAKRLLVLERLALQNNHITYEKCDDPEIQKLRTDLFSNSKSYGGIFKELIGEIDKLLYLLLKQQG